jgi:hypothetical protein
MARQLGLTVACALALTTSAVAQKSKPAKVGESPAAAILALQAELALTNIQSAKLAALAVAQDSAALRLGPSMIRVKADLLEAQLRDSAQLMRLALERQAKIQVDVAMARFQGDKAARAILTPDQRRSLQTIRDTATKEAAVDGRKRAVKDDLKRSLTSSARLSDSGTVRFTITPSSADIYVDYRRIGTGRIEARLPIGRHNVLLVLPGCATRDSFAIDLQLGPPVSVSRQVKC